MVSWRRHVPEGGRSWVRAHHFPLHPGGQGSDRQLAMALSQRACQQGNCGGCARQVGGPTASSLSPRWPRSLSSLPTGTALELVKIPLGCLGAG